MKYRRAFKVYARTARESADDAATKEDAGTKDELVVAG